MLYLYWLNLISIILILLFIKLFSLNQKNIIINKYLF